MNKNQRNVIAGLLIVFLISVIGLTIIIGIYIINNQSTGIPSIIMHETVVVPQTVIVPQTVMFEVTPTYTLIPSPTQTLFPQSNDRIVFLSVFEKDYYIVNADGTDMANITHDGQEEFCPQWNPDGKRISYYVRSANEGYYDVYIMDVNGQNRKFLFSAKLDLEYAQMPVWSPDGTKLAFSAYDELSDLSHIYIYDGKNITRLTDRPVRERYPVWSPDGDKIAYISYHLDRPLYVVASTDGVFHWLISDLTASNFSPPIWSPDGKNIVFISDPNIYISEFNYALNKDQLTNWGTGESFLPSWSPNGKTIAVYYREASCCGSEVLFFRQNSNAITSTSSLFGYDNNIISWSPDGTRIAVVGDVINDNWNIYIVDTEGNKEKITKGDHRYACPVWSP